MRPNKNINKNRLRRHTGSYRSNDATAETLGSDDSIVDDEEDYRNLDCSLDASTAASPPMDNNKKVEIEGLELLTLDEEDDDDEDDDYDGAVDYGEEVDSLVLTRKRLSRIWLCPRRRSRLPPRRRLYGPKGSLELARKRLPLTTRRRGRRHRTVVDDDTEAMPELESIEDMTPITCTDEEEEDFDDAFGDDNSSSSYDCSATVDSLELNRKRLADTRRNKNRPRRYGHDLIFLSNSNISSKHAHRRHPAINAKKCPGRIHSSRRGGPARKTFVHSLSPVRHHSGGRIARPLH